VIFALLQASIFISLVKSGLAVYLQDKKLCFFNTRQTVLEDTPFLVSNLIETSAAIFPIDHAPITEFLRTTSRIKS
jgi:hypothetical protein